MVEKGAREEQTPAVCRIVSLLLPLLYPSAFLPPRLIPVFFLSCCSLSPLDLFETIRETLWPRKKVNPLAEATTKQLVA